MQIGGVLGEAWGLYKRFLWQFFVTAAVVFALLDLLSALSQSIGSSAGVRLFWALVSAAVSVAGYYWVQAALVELVRDVRDGRADRSVGETYRAVAPRLPSVIGAGLLAAVAIAIGFLLLIVPGLILLTFWSMLVPAIVIEGRPAMEAFGRSRAIVSGNGFRVFGLFICTLLVVIVASLVIQAVFQAVLPDFLGTWLGGLVADSLTVPFAAIAFTTAYFHLTAGEPAMAAPVLD